MNISKHFPLKCTVAQHEQVLGNETGMMAITNSVGQDIFVGTRILPFAEEKILAEYIVMACQMAQLSERLRNFESDNYPK